MTGAALTGISSMATRAVLDELTDRYSRQTDMAVHIRPTGGVDAARRVRGGETFDIVVLASGVMAALEQEGLLLAGSRTDVACAFMGAAAPKGAPRPRLDDGDAVKAAILQARRIAYSTGPSGDHLLRLVEGWGIGEAVSQSLLQAPPGTPVASLLAQGEADLGFQQLSELINTAGVDVLGVLPPDIQVRTVFTGAVGGRSQRPDKARAFLAFLSSPDAEGAKRSHGMEGA